MDNNQQLPRWNWAAFSLNWIWGIGHKCYWPLLVFIPIPFWGDFWAIVCGFMGNKWLWASGCYDSVEELKNQELGWSIAGFVMTCIIVLYLIDIFSPIGLSGSSVRLYLQ